MRLFLTVISLLICCCAALAQQPQKYHKVLELMGSRFEISAFDADAQKAWDGINAAITEISRIERLISSWDPNSQTSLINRNAGIKPIKVDNELFQLIQRAVQISRITDGAFDISYASMDRIWKFDGSMKEMPDAEIVKEARSKIGFRNIQLNPAKLEVYLKVKGMKIGFGAIGKGYAAQKAKEKMSALGIKSGVVNAAGDLIAWGKDIDGESFKVGIADPRKKNHVLSWLKVNNTSVVTSGDYERYVLFDNVRYAHIIDPRTGYPTTGIKSVTIVSANPELADALSTSVFVLGIEKGLYLINQLQGVECLVITDNDEIVTSKHLEINNKS
ncbi:thiamine biosynthesis protein ApbE [Roseivirga sp. 4D4]|uniref:FAD:protein FMN transferase n=1 Tax=Roseivirga sp. 4D4 TaxID=1889784 RepID=UPI000853E9DC|nr:FAD:protein FMN transferase [Roseivirga sp. 4D4]OEK00892.1 thiamine biosynthesis protein ApbE [Roseivirga sp. 4D4]